MFLHESDRLQVTVSGQRCSLGLLPGEKAPLPYEPRIVNEQVEATLTEQHLLPHKRALEAFFLALRLMLDPLLCAAQPEKMGKAYPYGQCLEITRNMGRLLRKSTGLTLQGLAGEGQAAFTAFMQAGGSLRHAWGDLRGSFFQNALLLGTLYVDVSNDTVVVTKPKIEILPFADADFRPIRDFRHFMRLGEQYWQCRFYPNHALPELAPFCPLLRVTADGNVYLSEPVDYMLALAQARKFRPSEDILRTALLPASVLAKVRALMHDSRARVAASAEEGRRRALAACRRYRERHWHYMRPEVNPVLMQIRDANLRLVESQPLTPHRATVAPVDSTAYVAVRWRDHRYWHWQRPADFLFAAADQIVQLRASEAVAAARMLPLAFLQQTDHVVLVGLQGLRASQNLLVDAQGRWLGTHLPLEYHTRPFALSQQDGQKVLCIEARSCLPAPQPGSEPLFDADGKLTNELRQISATLAHASREHSSTLQLCSQLHALGLLQDWPVDTGTGQCLHGLLRINSRSLEQLSDADSAALRRSGAYQLAQTQLDSMQQVAALRQRVGVPAPPGVESAAGHNGLAAGNLDPDA